MCSSSFFIPARIALLIVALKYSALESQTCVSRPFVQWYIFLLFAINMYNMISQLNCVLNSYARSGTGKSLLKFSAKAYASIYNRLLALIEETLRHPYHGPRLGEQLSHWAREGW